MRQPFVLAFVCCSEVVKLFRELVAVGIYHITLQIGSSCGFRWFKNYADALGIAVAEDYILIFAAVANDIAVSIIYGGKIIVIGAYQACVFEHKAILINCKTLFTGARNKLTAA